MRQEGVDLDRTHVDGVPFLVKADEADDPVDVGVFGAAAVVARADGIADAVEQFRGLGGPSDRC